MLAAQERARLYWPLCYQTAHETACAVEEQNKPHDGESTCDLAYYQRDLTVLGVTPTAEPVENKGPLLSEHLVPARRECVSACQCGTHRSMAITYQPVASATKASVMSGIAKFLWLAPSRFTAALNCAASIHGHISREDIDTTRKNHPVAQSKYYLARTHPCTPCTHQPWRRPTTHARRLASSTSARDPSPPCTARRVAEGVRA